MKVSELTTEQFACLVINAMSNFDVMADPVILSDRSFGVHCFNKTFAVSIAFSRGSTIRVNRLFASRAADSARAASDTARVIIAQLSDALKAKISNPKDEDRRKALMALQTTLLKQHAQKTFLLHEPAGVSIHYDSPLRLTFHGARLPQDQALAAEAINLLRAAERELEDRVEEILADLEKNYLTKPTGVV